jgi:hypothetical protein
MPPIEIEQLFCDLTVVKTNLETNISNLMQKLEGKKRGVIFTETDLNFFKVCLENINKIINSSLPLISKDLQNLNEKRSFAEGQVANSMKLLSLCYNDYKATGRNDAVLALENGINSSCEPDVSLVKF